jgi:hypothetical protein
MVVILLYCITSELDYHNYSHQLTYGQFPSFPHFDRTHRWESASAVVDPGCHGWLQVIAG